MGHSTVWKVHFFCLLFFCMYPTQTLFEERGKSNKAPTRPNYSILNFLRKHYINFYSSFFPVSFALLNSAH